MEMEYPKAGGRRRLREAAGLTQYELAEIMGVTQVAISHWEQGEREPQGRFRYKYFATLAVLASQVGDGAAG